MRVALGFARRAIGDTAPNPLVGAVVVKSGRVVGAGYHRRTGLPHAEAVALRRAGGQARGASLYVTLEPCNHTGRTPPCCEAIIAAQIKHVVIAARDPNPITDGRGIACLRRAGIAVTSGVLRDEAETLNAPFRKFIRHHLPFVTIKVAQSLDGKIAARTGDSRWISSPASRRLVHQLRRESDAILVGVETVLHDDPRLTIRGTRRPIRTDRPLRVIVDSHLRIPPSSRCLSRAEGGRTVIATTERSSRKRARLERRGAEVLVFSPRAGRVPLRALCRMLAERFDVMALLIEGGGEVIASALWERLVDRLLVFIAPILIGGRTSPSAVGGAGIERLAEAIRLTGGSIRRVGDDVLYDAAVISPS